MSDLDPSLLEELKKLIDVDLVEEEPKVDEPEEPDESFSGRLAQAELMVNGL